MRVLVTVASREGSTLEIAETIAGVLRGRCFEVTVAPVDTSRDVGDFDAVVLGSAVYGGHWLPKAVTFAREHVPELEARPVWLFSSGPVGDPGHALYRRMYADPVDVPELAATTRAVEHRLFPGKLTAAGQPPLRRITLRVAPGLQGDYRDWDAIEAWAESIAATLAHAQWYRRLDLEEDVR